MFYSLKIVTDDITVILNKCEYYVTLEMAFDKGWNKN